MPSSILSVTPFQDLRVFWYLGHILLTNAQIKLRCSQTQCKALDVPLSLLCAQDEHCASIKTAAKQTLDTIFAFCLFFVKWKYSSNFFWLVITGINVCKYLVKAKWQYSNFWEQEIPVLEILIKLFIFKQNNKIRLFQPKYDKLKHSQSYYHYPNL